MEIFKSKKFWASLVGLVVTVLGHFGLDLNVEQIMTVVSPILAYVLGQAISDAGKERAKVEAVNKEQLAKLFAELQKAQNSD